MSWYYAENNERRGPIEDAAFDSLVAAGSVRPETLVWREGMTNWQALSASGYRRLGAPPPNMPPVPAGDGQEEPARRPGVEMGVCSESGRILPRSELVEIDGRLVSAEYKNVVLQRIREGVGSTGSSIDPEVLAQEIIARDYHLSIGACLSRGWGILKKNFWLCVLASFLTTLVIYASVLALIVGVFFVFGPVTAGLYWMMLRMHRNEPATVSDVFAGFSRSFWQLVGVGLLTLLGMGACFLPAGIAFGAAFAGSPKNPSPALMGVAGLLALAAYIVMIYLAVAWMFSLILVIDKRIEAWPAMRLSRRIVGMHWWRVFGVLFVTVLLIFGVIFGVMIVLPLLANLIVGASLGSPTAVIISMCCSLVSSLLSMALTPMMYATIAVAYDDIFGTPTIRH